MTNPYIATFTRSLILMGAMYLYGFTIFASYSAAVVHDAISLYVIFQTYPKPRLWSNAIRHNR
jgi:hypothetical protein